MIIIAALGALALVLFDLAHVTRERPVTRLCAIAGGVGALAALMAAVTHDTWLSRIAEPALMVALAALLWLLLHAPGAPLRTRNTLNGDRPNDQP